ncbi:MAG: hypothetical protein ACRES7_00135 [Gammaproteobacteria bacterium]
MKHKTDDELYRTMQLMFEEKRANFRCTPTDGKWWRDYLRGLDQATRRRLIWINRAHMNSAIYGALAGILDEIDEQRGQKAAPTKPDLRLIISNPEDSPPSGG